MKKIRIALDWIYYGRKGRKEGRRKRVVWEWYGSSNW